MMRNNILRLIKIQLLDVTGLNKARYEKTSKSHFKGLLSAAVVLLVGAVFILYSALIAYGYIQMQLPEVIMPMMFALASMAVLFTSIFKTSGLIFAARDYDMLQALPIRSSDIIVSRFTTLYLLDLAFSICILIPSGIIYGMHMSSGILFYILLVFLTLFIPVIPLVIATVIGTLLLAISSRFRHKNIIMILLSTLAMVGVMILSFSLQSVDMSKFASINEAMLNMVYNIFPTTRLFNGALCEGNFLQLLMFILINVLIYFVFLQIIARLYKKINTAVTTHRQQANYKVTALKSTSTRKALYQKELRRYFSSPIYVLNTAIGPVLMLLFGIVVALGYASSILNVPGFEAVLPKAIPFILGFLAVMNATTSSSISLEGQGFWQLLVLPIDKKDVYNSKRLVTFTFGLPAVIISGILIQIKLMMPFLDAMMMFLVPLAFLYLTCEGGLYFNLKYPNFNWKTETTVVKQSVPTMITTFGGMLLTFAPLFIIISLPQFSTLLQIAGFVIPAALAIVFRCLSSKVDLRTLQG